MRMRITFYDGTDTIGGNKIYVEEKGRGVFLDFGKNFTKYDSFFLPQLKERSARGITDTVAFGLAPKIDAYRPDLIPSDLDVSSFQRINPEAVLISHSHLDHCGYVSLLKNSIPLVGSPITLASIKARSDIGNSGFQNEVAYYTPKKKGTRRILRF